MVFSSLRNFGGAKAISAGLLLSALAVDAARIELQGRNVPSNVARAIALAKREAVALQRRQEIPDTGADDDNEDGEDDDAPPPPTDGGENLEALMDLVFVSPITLGGTEYNVVVDASSSDVWVDKAPATATPKNVKAAIAYDYPGGQLKVDGVIGTAALKFGNYEVPEQAFVDIEQDFSATGVNGMLGLGLGRGPSAVQSAVKAADAGAEYAQTVLENYFDTKNDEANYVALNIKRPDPTSEKPLQGGVVSIGEVEPEYAAIKESPKVPLYPETSPKWTFLIEKISIAGHHLSLESTIKDVPAKHAVGWVTPDLAGPAGYLPEKVFDELYTKIPEAVKYEDKYIVPCNVPMEVSLYAGGHHYPLHPLDLTKVWKDRPESVKGHTVCISSLSAKEPNPDYDITVGWSFLRNIYTFFDFGDFPEGSQELGPAYLKFLSKANHTVGNAEFAAARQKTELPELTPAETVALLKGGASGTDSDPSASVAITPAVLPTESTVAGGRTHHGHHSDNKNKNVNLKTNNGAKEAGESDSGSSNTDSSSSSSSTWSKFMPAIIALLAVNLVVALVLMVLGVLNYIKKSGAAKGSVPHYIPVSKGADGSHTIIFDSEASGSKNGSGSGYTAGTTRYGD